MEVLELYSPFNTSDSDYDYSEEISLLPFEVKCVDSANWFKWIAALRNHAVNQGVWDMINPEGIDDPNDIPKAPEPPSLGEIFSEAEALCNGDNKLLSQWILSVSSCRHLQWQREHDAWLRKVRKVTAINIWISKTVEWTWYCCALQSLVNNVEVDMPSTKEITYSFEGLDGPQLNQVRKEYSTRQLLREIHRLSGLARPADSGRDPTSVDFPKSLTNPLRASRNCPPSCR